MNKISWLHLIRYIHCVLQLGIIGVHCKLTRTMKICNMSCNFESTTNFDFITLNNDKINADVELINLNIQAVQILSSDRKIEDERSGNK